MISPTNSSPKVNCSAMEHNLDQPENCGESGRKNNLFRVVRHYLIRHYFLV